MEEIPESKGEIAKRRRREKKAEKKAVREANRLQNALRCDTRAHVRIAASEKLWGPLSGGHASAPSAQEPAISESTSTETTAETGLAVVSLCALDLLDFSLALLPSSLVNLVSLDVSHNKLSALPGLASLSSLTELNICRNLFKILPPSLRQLPRLAKLNASRSHMLRTG